VAVRQRGDGHAVIERVEDGSGPIRIRWPADYEDLSTVTLRQGVPGIDGGWELHIQHEDGLSLADPQVLRPR
jgi:hypothetical protein